MPARPARGPARTPTRTGTRTSGTPARGAPAPARRPPACPQASAASVMRPCVRTSGARRAWRRFGGARIAGPAAPETVYQPLPVPAPEAKGMSKEQMEIRELKEGRFMLIDDEPCKIDSIEKSKPGKHGASKVRIEAGSLFTGAKRTYLGSVTDKVWVPQVDKRTAQLLSFHVGVAELVETESV